MAKARIYKWKMKVKSQKIHSHCTRLLKIKRTQTLGLAFGICSFYENLIIQNRPFLHVH